MKGKLIVVEGTDCSGKETQTKLLVEHLKSENLPIERLTFPMYETPTGKIVGGAYLGKKEISEGYFEEGAANVDPYVASLYFAADRKYNINKVTSLLNSGINVILDRYVGSNMAHQAGKIYDDKSRHEMYQNLELLEYQILKLPRPDMTIFLYMPYEYASVLKKNRTNIDQHEASEEHLVHAEKTYLEMAEIFSYETINCIKDNQIRNVEDINKEVITKVKKIIKH